MFLVVVDESCVSLRWRKGNAESDPDELGERTRGREQTFPSETPLERRTNQIEGGSIRSRGAMATTEGLRVASASAGCSSPSFFARGAPWLKSSAKTAAPSRGQGSFPKPDPPVREELAAAEMLRGLERLGPGPPRAVLAHISAPSELNSRPSEASPQSLLLSATPEGRGHSSSRRPSDRDLSP